jgi:hypothetical protein
MSLRPTCFVVSIFDQSDWLKLLGIACAMVALYVIARRLGGGNEAAPPPGDITSSTPFSTSRTVPTELEGPQAAEIGDPDQPGYTLLPEQEGDEPGQQNTIEIRAWNFATFEIETGPPDRNCFADDLWMDLYDSSTGHGWRQTYFVATPAGLEKMLRDNQSNFMFLPQVLVLNRYDVNELRKAVFDDLRAMEEQRGDVPPDASDATAAGQRE